VVDGPDTQRYTVESRNGVEKERGTFPFQSHFLRARRARRRQLLMASGGEPGDREGHLLAFGERLARATDEKHGMISFDMECYERHT
jgi:hypothetical protein